MEVNKKLGKVRIDGYLNLEAPEGWGEKVYHNDSHFGEIKYDYNLLEEHIEDKLEEAGIEVDIDFIDNAGEEEEHIQLVIQQ